MNAGVAAGAPGAPGPWILAFGLGLLIDLVYLLLLVFLIPWLAYLILIKRRGVGSLAERTGGVEVPATDAPRVWVHAVSVGEVEAALPLIAALRETLPDLDIVVSTTTTTARKMADRRLPGTPLFLFPLDVGFCVRRTLRRVRPALLVLMELELWPNLLLACDSAGVPVVVANGRISRRGFARMSRARWLLAPFFRRLRYVLVQNDEYRERLAGLGVAPDRLEIVGNLKFDRSSPEEPEDVRRDFEEAWGHAAGSPRWIAGCTHPGEEEKVFTAHEELRKRHPGLGLIVAPRHVERSREVVDLARGKGFEVSCHSDGATGTGAEVLVVDVTGELARLYACADVAFVGGSLVPHGGHNILEPVLMGTPAAHGPFMGNFREIVDLLTGGDATLEVGGMDDLVEQIDRWLGDAESRADHAGRAQHILEQHRGAAVRSVTRISEVLRAQAAVNGQ